jgi:hypothetical protein
MFIVYYTKPFSKCLCAKLRQDASAKNVITRATNLRRRQHECLGLICSK